MEDKEEGTLQESVKWLESLLDGTTHELESISLGGLRVLHARRGFFRCSFTVSSHVSDKDGNWEVGAMSVVIDDVGAAAIYSIVGHVKVSVQFAISSFTKAKTNEEVVIEAKMVGEKERLALVVVEITRKHDGKLIAFANQWMASGFKAISFANHLASSDIISFKKILLDYIVTQQKVNLLCTENLN